MYRFLRSSLQRYFIPGAHIKSMPYGTFGRNYSAVVNECASVEDYLLDYDGLLNRGLAAAANAFFQIALKPFLPTYERSASCRRAKLFCSLACGEVFIAHKS